MLKWWKSFYSKSDNAKAYVLLSPALVLVVLGMAVPLFAVFSVSFTTQASFVIDYTPTFDRYIEFMDTSTRTGNVLTIVKDTGGSNSVRIYIGDTPIATSTGRY